MANIEEQPTQQVTSPKTSKLKAPLKKDKIMKHSYPNHNREPLYDRQSFDIA